MADAPGYSGKPLAAKLGIKPGHRVGLAGAPGEVTAALRPAAAGLFEVASVDLLPPTLDMIHFFATEHATLATALPKLRARIFPAGALWISWPKKSARVPTDVTGDIVRALALGGGLVDVKVCAVTEVWSGLKLVVPVAARPPKPARKRTYDGRRERWFVRVSRNQASS